MEGILTSELSLGCLVWNLQRFVEDFKTGKRVSLVHPQHEWITSEVPAFQSVDDETWANGQAPKSRFSGWAGNKRQTKKRLQASSAAAAPWASPGEIATAATPAGRRAPARRATASPSRISGHESWAACSVSLQATRSCCGPLPMSSGPSSIALGGNRRTGGRKAERPPQSGRPL
jgi:hypothetical protein